MVFPSSPQARSIMKDVIIIQPTVVTSPHVAVEHEFVRKRRWGGREGLEKRI